MTFDVTLTIHSNTTGGYGDELGWDVLALALLLQVTALRLKMGTNLVPCIVQRETRNLGLKSITTIPTTTTLYRDFKIPSDNHRSQ